MKKDRWVIRLDLFRTKRYYYGGLGEYSAMNFGRRSLAVLFEDRAQVSAARKDILKMTEYSPEDVKVCYVGRL